MGIELGHTTKAGFKKQTGAWGAAPMLIGANDGFELLTDTVKAAQDLQPNRGNFGSPFPRPATPGNFLVQGDAVLDLYYQCFGHRFLGMAFADAVTALGAGAHRHDLTLRTSLAGVLGTLVVPGTEGVREYGSAKVRALKLRWDESDQRAKLTAMLVAHDYNLNVGAPDVAFVVASVAVGTGAQTVLAQALAPFTPSPLTFTKPGTVTAINVTVVAEDRWGAVYSKTFTETDFVSNLWTDTTYVRRVISVTINSFTGSGNVSAGVSNGINNASTIAAITMEASRVVSTFSQLEFLVNRQGDGALSVATDEQFLKSFELGIELNLDTRVTTQYGNRIDEPALAGAGEHAKVTVAFEFSAHTDKNRTRLYDTYQGNQLKAKATLTGEQIASSGTPHKIEVWMNGVQFPPADGPNVGNAGVMPVSFSGEAHLVAAVPTGFPAGADEPCMIQITNGLATQIVS